MLTIHIPLHFVLPLLAIGLIAMLFMGLLHEFFWPGKNVTNGLPVWLTQILGTLIIFGAFTVYYLGVIGDSQPPFILAVLIVFCGIAPLGLRAIRKLIAFIHKTQVDEKVRKLQGSPPAS